jgi:cbb3-type cytochrome oxidase cytochrome c subunit
MFESKSGVLLIAGVGFFALAFVSNALVPILMYSGDKYKEKTAFEAANDNTVGQMEELKRLWPQAFKEQVEDVETLTRLPAPELNQYLKTKYPRDFRELPKELVDLPPEPAANLKEEEKEEKRIARQRVLQAREQFILRFPAAEMLLEGRKWYIAEACWHCHSQFIRPVAQEDKRWGGGVSRSWEYQNELQRPVMFGTRRVGPDLSREGGRRSTDWLAVHLYRPKSTSPYSVMPSYTWYFHPLDPEKAAQLHMEREQYRSKKSAEQKTKEEKETALTKSIDPVPTRRGMALLLYIQWLGSWLPDYPYYDGIDRTKVRGDYK